MRLIPILTAFLVTGFLYLMIFEREALLAFAQATPIAARDDDEIADELRRISVVAVQSEARQIDDGVLMRGETEAARQVEVRAETSGLVISDPLRSGASVEAGDLLCELNPGTREASLAEARAGLAEANIELNAAQRLSEGGFASETRLAAAEAAAEGAQAAVAAAETEIERLRIMAPFAGLLESDTAEIGSLLQAGSLCATVIQLDPIKLVGFVPETEVSRIGVGAPAFARLASGREVAGSVRFLSRSADDTTRTFRVEVEVANEDLTIRDGQTAEIIVQADGVQAHLLPQSALTLNDQGDLGVRTVASDQTALFVPVTLLRDTVEGVWLGGLDDTVEVIVVGQEFVSDGIPVDVTFRDPQTPEETPVMTDELPPQPDGSASEETGQ
ncbi:efflux RND transporter periplasmic adaptor subunit [Aestuariibius sp. 2305UL40-4]|uniref:efflux RND transporter periplasmic adaptor subunit n=1 Tax=Aestuariibius violaceus TaxID=3234132 RepID=UPI00345E7F55